MILREAFHIRGRDPHDESADVEAEGKIREILVADFPLYGYQGEELGFLSAPHDEAGHLGWLTRMTALPPRPEDSAVQQFLSRCCARVAPSWASYTHIARLTTPATGSPGLKGKVQCREMGETSPRRRQLAMPPKVQSWCRITGTRTLKRIRSFPLPGGFDRSRASGTVWLWWRPARRRQRFQPTGRSAGTMPADMRS
jgi:hypothetical protein